MAPHDYDVPAVLQATPYLQRSATEVTPAPAPALSLLALFLSLSLSLPPLSHPPAPGLHFPSPTRPPRATYLLGRFRTDVNRGMGWVISLLMQGCERAPPSMLLAVRSGAAYPPASSVSALPTNPTINFEAKA